MKGNFTMVNTFPSKFHFDIHFTLMLLIMIKMLITEHQHNNLSCAWSPVIKYVFHVGNIPLGSAYCMVGPNLLRMVVDYGPGTFFSNDEISRHTQNYVGFHVALLHQTRHHDDHRFDINLGYQLPTNFPQPSTPLPTALQWLIAKNV